MHPGDVQREGTTILQLPLGVDYHLQIWVAASTNGQEPLALRIEDWYSMELFEPDMQAWKEHMVPVTRSIYDHVIVDSQVERGFVHALEERDDIHFFIKLPNWLTVPTPIGNYNPDWAISMDDPETGEQRLYLIHETKGSHDVTSLQYDHERRKVHCGQAHFEGALEIPYTMGPSPTDLPGSTRPLIH